MDPKNIVLKNFVHMEEMCKTEGSTVVGAIDNFVKHD